MTAPHRKRTWFGLLAGGIATAVAIVVILAGVPGGRRGGGPAASPQDLEMFVAHEHVRDFAWPSMNAAASLVASRIPEREGDPDRLLFVQAIAKKRGVALVATTFDVPQTSEDGSMTRADVRVTLSGRADAVVSVLADIEAADRIVTIEGATLTRAPEGASVRLELRLAFPMRVPGVDLGPFVTPMKGE